MLRFLALASVLALALHVRTQAIPASAPIRKFGLRCDPDNVNGRTRKGALGCCENSCFAKKRLDKPWILTRGTSRQEDPGCRAGVNQKGQRGCSPCTIGNSEFGTEPGLTCDEYPFASTVEGWASNQSASLRCIPAGENCSGGSQLKDFYKAANVTSGEKFAVLPLYNHSNAALVPKFCTEQRPSPDNRQFVCDNGTLVSAESYLQRRFAREANRAEPDDTEATKVQPIFETSLGLHTIAFDPSAKVGDEFWTESLEEEGVVIKATLKRIFGWTNGTKTKTVCAAAATKTIRHYSDLYQPAPRECSEVPDVGSTSS